MIRRGSRGHRSRRHREIAEKLRALDNELLSFYEFCEKMGFSSQEMDLICSPVFIERANLLSRLIKYATVLVLISTLTYGVSHVTPVANHSAAVARIGMIKLLSVWDWRPLFTEPCLVNNPLHGEYGLTNEDCMTCEALNSINVISKANYQILAENYFSRDAPVIVTDATENWDLMKPGLDFKNITKLFLGERQLTDSLPCILSTNLRQGGPDLQSFLKIVDSPSLDKWFAHWQNCDINAVKALRKFYGKPYFLPNTISPAHYNWVLMSSDYNSRNYKSLELDLGLIMLIQLRGTTTVRLLPYKPCNATCVDLSAVLHQGEILVLRNYLWNLEYLPGSGQDNIAILTETVWDQHSA